MAYLIGQSITMRSSGASYAIKSVDNVLGTLTLSNGAVVAQEDVYNQNQQPAISISAPTGLRMATDPPTKAGVF